MKLNLNSPTLKFSVSGLRGVYPTDINPDNAPSIIWAYHKSIGPGPIAIGRDNRPTGAALEEIVSGVCIALGRTIYKAGILPTPTVKALVKSKKLAGAIMISASHNPIEYNAFKFIKKDGFFFEKKDNEKFVDFLKKTPDWGSPKNQGVSHEYKAEAATLHIDAVCKALPKSKNPVKLKVAIDTLGACATDIIPLLLDKLGVAYYSLFPEIAPGFPRGPEPVPSALKKLGRFVLEKKCDIGFAFDPDADRLAIVGPDGTPIGEELTLPLAMSQALKSRKGTVVVNLSSSYYNNIVAEKMGCKIKRSSVGEANVVAEMLKSKAVFGGEGNGGVIDPGIPSYGRDSLAGVAWIIHYLQQGNTLREFLNSLPNLVMKKTAVKGDHKVYTRYAGIIKKELKGWKLDTRDGLHFSSPEGLPWIHLRASNTEPVIRVIAEGRSSAQINQLFSLLK